MHSLTSMFRQENTSVYGVSHRTQVLNLRIHKLIVKHHHSKATSSNSTLLVVYSV
ncbi:hypothetical protein Hanom_Chr15g01413251 [Helianthus anomalus]